MLCRRDLVVLCLRENAELPELFVQLLHERGDARLDRAEIVVLKLLTLRGACAEQRAAREDQVGALVVELLVHKEVLLLGADRRVDALGGGVAEEAEDAHGLRAEGLHRAQERRLLVEHFAAVGAERRRNVQRMVLDERIGGRVPRRVASRLKGGAQAAGGEGGGVRLALDELLAGEFHDDPAIGGRRDEAVVFFGGNTGHRLEPVRVVRRTVFNRPVLHRVCNCIRNSDVEVLAVVDRLAQGFVNVLRETLTHDAVVEDHAGEEIRHAFVCCAAHKTTLSSFIIVSGHTGNVCTEKGAEDGISNHSAFAMLRDVL